MTTERNKATIRRIREEAVGRSGADLDFLDGLFAEGYRYHGGAAFGEMTGPDAYKNMLQGMSAVLGDYRERVVDQVAEGNVVVSRIEGSGNATGELLGIDGRGRPFTSDAISIARFNDAGQIEEEWVQADTFGIIQQLQR
jgi:predicted ester cyclase